MSITYVKPPRPIRVKKLIENLAFLGLSLGNKPLNASSKALKTKFEKLMDKKDMNTHAIYKGREFAGNT